MKLLEFECIEDKNIGVALDPENMEQVYFVHLEGKDEEKWHDDYVADGMEMFWNGYMTAKLGEYTSDSDIFYYFSSEEKVPAVGETFELDDMVWERVK